MHLSRTFYHPFPHDIIRLLVAEQHHTRFINLFRRKTVFLDFEQFTLRQRLPAPI